MSSLADDALPVLHMKGRKGLPGVQGDDGSRIVTKEPR